MYQAFASSERIEKKTETLYEIAQHVNYVHIRRFSYACELITVKNWFK